MTRDEAAGIVLGRVMEDEGGIADVGDGMGLTRFGQTPAWLATFGLPAPKNAEEALANYRTWLARTRLIVLCDYPDVFAWTVIDRAVNSGHLQAIRLLQRALGVLPADGILGPDTEHAALQADRRALAYVLVASSVRYDGRLVTDVPIKAPFAATWARRRARQIEALATL